MNSNSVNAVLSTCLMGAPFWCRALEIVSTTASLIAAVTGAIIGCITLYRMWSYHHRNR